MPDYMHYEANYLLIVDNLSDFAHLAFVHTKTLGGSEEYAYSPKPIAIERLERRLSRRALAHGRRRPAVPPEGRSAKDARSTAATSRHMYVPGIFFMETLFSPAGSGAEKGNLEGASIPQLPVHDAGDARARRTSSGTTSRLEGDDPTIRARCASLIEGFMEDKASSRVSR